MLVVKPGAILARLERTLSNEPAETNFSRCRDALSRSKPRLVAESFGLPWSASCEEKQTRPTRGSLECIGYVLQASKVAVSLFPSPSRTRAMAIVGVEADSPVAVIGDRIRPQSSTHMPSARGSRLFAFHGSGRPEHLWMVSKHATVTWSPEDGEM